MINILRPYQHRDLNAILGYLQRRVSCVYALPTGGGKTCTAVEGIRRVSDQGWRVLVTVHRRELLRQMSGALTRVGLGHGVIAAGEPAYDCPIQLASIDTLRARLTQGHLAEVLNRVDLLVTDECHHQAAASWASIVQATPRAVRLGLTATPWRLDGRPLAPFYDAAVRGPSVAKLIHEGYLVPARVIAPPANLNLGGVRRVAGDYNLGQLAEMLDTDDVTRIAV
ncbi:MAG: DEAD/DEAH box helicase family protein, partial [Rhodospirillaceae bacterium]